MTSTIAAASILKKFMISDLPFRYFVPVYHPSAHFVNSNGADTLTLYTTLTINLESCSENIAIVHKSAQISRLRIDYSKICDIIIMNIYVPTQRSMK